VRTWNIAKNLSRLGWNVTVVTPLPSVWRDVDDVRGVSSAVEKEHIRRILTDHWYRFLEPEVLSCYNQGMHWVIGGVCRRITRWLQIEAAIGWARAAELACASLTANDVDVILATASPFSSFGLAKRLSAKIGRPYVLDYRDPWTDNPHVDSRPSAKTIQQEKQLLTDCSAVTIVSPSWAKSMADRFSLGEKLHIVTNGYDAEELDSIKPKDFGHFAIVYTGIFYPPKRVITPIMAALKYLKENTDWTDRAWYFHYYGREEDHAQAEATKFNVIDRVVLHGNVPRSEALAAVRGAGVAVIITTIDELASVQDQGIIPGKIFETIGLGAPILLIAPPNSDAATILRNTGIAGIYNGQDIRGIAAFLDARIKGESMKVNNTQAYAWPNIAKRLDSILRRIHAQSW